MKQLLLLLCLAAGMVAGAQDKSKVIIPLTKYLTYTNDGVKPKNLKVTKVQKVSSSFLEFFKSLKYLMLIRMAEKEYKAAKEISDLSADLVSYDGGQSLHNMNMEKTNKALRKVRFYTLKKQEAEDAKENAQMGNFVCYLVESEYVINDPVSMVQKAYEAETLMTKDYKIIDLASVIEFFED